LRHGNNVDDLHVILADNFVKFKNLLKVVGF